MPFWIKRAHARKLVGRDMQKIKKPLVAEGGGLMVLGGFSAGVLLYVALNTFVFENAGISTFIFSLLCVLFISSFVGILDDLLGWKKGLSKRVRILIVLFASIPLMVINAGNPSINLPFFGVLNLGLFYPLLIIPIGIIGATTTYNFLAGYNGLEAGQGIIILSALALVTFLTGNPWLSVVSLCMVAALLAFYIFNRYPARVFPGDILTYSVGALIAVIAILGDIEKIAILFFIPYILEFFLKLRGKLKVESFANLNTDGSLEAPHKKVYGLTHVALKILKKIKPSKKVYEREVVALIHLFQIIIILLVFVLSF